VQDLRVEDPADDRTERDEQQRLEQPAAQLGQVVAQRHRPVVRPGAATEHAPQRIRHGHSRR
jgi:hypothetical protein